MLVIAASKTPAVNGGATDHHANHVTTQHRRPPRPLRRLPVYTGKLLAVLLLHVVAVGWNVSAVFETSSLSPVRTIALSDLFYMYRWMAGFLREAVGQNHGRRLRRRRHPQAADAKGSKHARLTTPATAFRRTARAMMV